MEDQNAPATKGDLNEAVAQLRSEMKGDLNEAVAQLRSEMSHGYNDIVERLSDSETKLLGAFYSFAQSNQKRMVEVEGNEAALRSRVGTIESRLLEVEKRLNMPPAA